MGGALVHIKALKPHPIPYQSGVHEGVGVIKLSLRESTALVTIG